MHSHEHIHDANCSCGREHGTVHAHEHEHDENCTCGISEEKNEAFHVEVHLHDEALVISARLSLISDYDAVKTALASQLEALASAVQEQGGIVGHIKASCDVHIVEMFSLTDTETSVKRNGKQEIALNLAAIVFLIEPEVAEKLVRAALEKVLDTAGGQGL